MYTVSSTSATEPDAKLSILHNYNFAGYNEVLELLYLNCQDVVKKSIEVSGLPSHRHADVLSNTFYAAIEGIHVVYDSKPVLTVRYKMEEHPLATAKKWLLGILRNKIADARKASRREAWLSDEVFAEPTIKSFDDDEDYAQVIESIISKALNSLKESQRLAIMLRDLDGISCSEIQQQLGLMSVEAAKALCSRARRRWREKALQLASRELLKTPQWDTYKRGALRNFINKLQKKLS
jgi:RNA polymerase sigma factor (sigma-70 family)